MDCVFPTCKYYTDRAFSDEITFHRFPEEETLRKEWLHALSIEDSQLDTDSAVCSNHFLKEDFVVTRRGRKLRADAVPVENVLVCRICFASNCMLYPLKDDIQPDLSRPSYALAYEILTGIMITEEDKLPPYLCVHCANRLMRSVRFRARIIRAHSILTDIVTDNDHVTSESLLSIGSVHDSPSSYLTDDPTHTEFIKSDMSRSYEQDMMDNLKVEDDGVFDQQILITDVRSTNDDTCLSDFQDDLVCDIKIENEDMIDKAVLNNSSPRLHDDTTVDYFQARKGSVGIQNNSNEERRHGIGIDMDVGEDCSLNKNLPQDIVRQKHEILPTKVKKLTRASKASNQTELTGKLNKPQVNGGLLLVYKLWSCEICDYKTDSKAQIKRHLEAHDATRLLRCSKCCSKNSLLVHAGVHSKKNPYLCDADNKTFSYNNYLRTLLRMHTAERPIMCKVCNKEFRQKCQVHEHV